MKILFIGGGNMAQAILGGLIANGMNSADAMVVEPYPATQEKLTALGFASRSQFDEIATAHAAIADVIVLAVKPQMMADAIAPLKGRLCAQLVLSIAAGVRLADLQRALGGHDLIVRTMPNTPALILRGITGLYAGAAVDSAQRARAEALMQSVGKTVWFSEESMLDAVTAVSGSGPAYVFYFIEALEAAARDLGMTADAARLFAIETFTGAAALAAQSADSPAVLRANVTSKRGTTERAIEHFDQDALKQKFVAGVKAAAARSSELGDELAQSLQGTGHAR